MDQVRAILKATWQQRFWVLTVLGLLVAVICWHSAAGQLDTEFTKRKSAIDGHFKAMSNLRNQAVHPNEKVNQKDLEQSRQQRDAGRHRPCPGHLSAAQPLADPGETRHDP